MRESKFSNNSFFKKFHKDNSGATLVVVLIVVAFIAVLGSVAIAGAMVNLKMKVVDKKAKKTFYSCEEAVDEIYSELTYGRDHVSIASLPEMKDRSIVINGFSKAFAMTGWRLGYVAAPRYMMKQMVKVHQFCIMAAPTTSQYAAIEAMRSCDDEVEEMRTAYNQRRRFLVHEFQRMGIECFEPEGAFYIFPSIKKFGMTSEEFATKLLNEEKVAIVPGSAFGACGEGYLRVSYAYSIEELKEALGRLERFINHLPKKQ